MYGTTFLICLTNSQVNLEGFFILLDFNLVVR
uniref:Uncharacterized protein n=1 Tax=Tetranychus urticae TaxID=32264 RepID=T1KIG6_TETUR